MDDRREPVRGRRLGRSVRPAGMLARSAAGRVVRRVGSIGASEATRERRDAAFHAREAARYAQALGDMKGALMKIGQLLAFVDVSFVPERYRGLYQEAFATLLDDVPPMQPALVREVVAAELGAPPGEVFASFDEVPIAAASIGQVHRASLADGTELAVKVQYPGVADAIAADLSNVELLGGFARLGQALLGYRADLREMVEEVRDRVQDELDYTIEAENQTLFADLYRRHPYVRIPDVHRALSTSRVLTMDLARGRRFAEAVRAPDELRQTWAEVLYRFVFRSMDRFFVFNADPHPGNYLFGDDGTVTFLDFGCVRRFEPARVEANIGLIRSLAEQDPDGLRSALVEGGFIAAADDSDTSVFLEHLGPLADPHVYSPFTFTHAWVEDNVSRIYSPLGDARHVVRKFSMPAENTFLTRIDIGLWSLLAALQAHNDWRSINYEMWDGAPPVTRMGHEEAAWLATRPAVTG